MKLRFWRGSSRWQWHSLWVSSWGGGGSQVHVQWLLHRRDDGSLDWHGVSEDGEKHMDLSYILVVERTGVVAVESEREGRNHEWSLYFSLNNLEGQWCPKLQGCIVEKKHFFKLFFGRGGKDQIGLGQIHFEYVYFVMPPRHPSTKVKWAAGDGCLEVRREVGPVI